MSTFLAESPKTKRLVYIVGSSIGAVLAAILLIGGCGLLVKAALAERPSFNTGTIIERDYDKAWTETGLRQQYVGETCSTINNTRTCTSNYIWVPYSVDHPAQWDIRIKNCQVRKKDGTLWVDKNGQSKCFTKWVDVDETTYNRVKVGQEWMG